MHYIEKKYEYNEDYGLQMRQVKKWIDGTAILNYGFCLVLLFWNIGPIQILEIAGTLLFVIQALYCKRAIFSLFGIGYHAVIAIINILFWSDYSILFWGVDGILSILTPIFCAVAYALVFQYLVLHDKLKLMEGYPYFNNVVAPTSPAPRSVAIQPLPKPQAQPMPTPPVQPTAFTQPTAPMADAPAQPVKAAPLEMEELTIPTLPEQSE